MGRAATVGAGVLPQAAGSEGAPGSPGWWLLAGGCGATVLALVLSSLLYRAFCRRGSQALENAAFFTGLAAYGSVLCVLWGAGRILDAAPGGPWAGTGAFPLLLASTLVVGAVLVGALVLSRTAVPPVQDRGLEPVPEFLLAFAVVVDLVTGVLAVLGAAGVLHLDLVRTVAWAVVGTGLGVLAALVLAALAWTVAGIANP